MAFVVEMARGRPGSPGFQTFSCPGRVWRDMLAIARSFGWVPQGTMPDPRPWSPDYKFYFEPTYDPDDWAYSKQITAEDAANLAAAVRRANAAISEGTLDPSGGHPPVLIREGMNAWEMLMANARLADLLPRFARFAEAGAFVFAWDEAPEFAAPSFETEPAFRGVELETFASA